jgi:hypothetical protein
MKASYLFLLLLISVPGFARQPDTAFVTAAISHGRQLYHTRMKGEWPLNSGGQYVEYVSIEGEHPYFIPAWSNGTVQYLDDIYYHVPLLLDLSTDKLVTQHTLFDIAIQLSSEKVKKFTLEGHRFANLRQDSIKTLPESGFYEILQSGNVSLIARRKKSIQRSISAGKVVAILKESNAYYLLKDGETLPVSSRRSLLNALKDQPALRAQLKKNKIRFGANRETGLAASVRIYNELQKSR